jgi:hypothetical protein
MPDVDYLVETEKALDTFIATKEQQRRFKKLDGNSFIQAVAMFGAPRSRADHACPPS